MSLIPRDSLFDIDRFFSPFFGADNNRELQNSFFTPRVDIKDKKDHYEITAELAGVKKEDIQLKLENGVLTLSAHTEQEKTDEEDGRVIRRERRSGQFMRSFALGDDVHQEDIQARFDNGLLTLKVPKLEQAKQISKSISIQ